jgi:hypothetical protein
MLKEIFKGLSAKTHSQEPAAVEVQKPAAVESDNRKKNRDLFHADVLIKGVEKMCLVEAPSQEVAENFLTEKIRRSCISTVEGIELKLTGWRYMNPEKKSPELHEKIVSEIIPAIVASWNEQELQKPREERQWMICPDYDDPYFQKQREEYHAWLVVADESDKNMNALFNDIIQTKVVSIRPIGGEELASKIRDQVVYERQYFVDNGNFKNQIIMHAKQLHSPVVSEFYEYAGVPVRPNDRAMLPRLSYGEGGGECIS